MRFVRAWLDKSADPWKDFRRGDVLPEGHAAAEVLLASGTVVVEPAPEPEPADAVEDTPEADEVVEDEPAPDPEDVDRPRKAAPLEDWRKYAVSKGIDPKGLSKPEIQAATT